MGLLRKKLVKNRIEINNNLVEQDTKKDFRRF